MFQCQFSNGDLRTVGFIPIDPRIKVGAQVQLIDTDTKERTWWNVDAVGVPVRRDRINRGWDNNI
jgi:hypothetical protein